MKIFASTLTALFLCVSFLGLSSGHQPINAIIGDQSSSELGLSSQELSEQQRITIHLSYVEHLLRTTNVQHLSRKQKRKRSEALDLLHTYWTKGSFPVNLAYPNERKPCFRDASNTLCAVGYLVHETGGEVLVDEIEENMNYALIEEMNSEALIRWADENGLSVTECAMIQPTYGGGWGWGYYPSTISFGNAVATSTLSGLNASSLLIGSIHLNNNRTGIALPIVGIGTGLGQITLGAINASNYDFSSLAHKRVTMVNFGIGTLTTAFNTYVLVRSIKNRKKNNDLSWNLFGHQNPYNNQFAMGVSLRKQL